MLFFSPGGAFRRDSGGDNLNGPDFLVEQNIIVVTFNYRLSVFGFLSLKTPLYSGNMALKDQQLALKWIHTNIVRFGGDDTRITLGGFSAGKPCPNSDIFFVVVEFSTRSVVTVGWGYIFLCQPYQNRCNVVKLSSVER